MEQARERERKGGWLGWGAEEERREDDSSDNAQRVKKNARDSCPLPSARIQLAKDKRFACLFFCIVGRFEIEAFLENLHSVLSD